MKNKTSLSGGYLKGFLLLAILSGFVFFQKLPFDTNWLQSSVIRSSNPAVANVFPANGARIHKNYKVFGIKFTVPMNASTLNTTTLILKDNNNIGVVGTVSYDQNTWTAYFKADSDLNVTASPSNNPFTFALSEAAKDVKNKAIGPLSVKYTVENKFDTSKQRMAWSNPVQGLSNVDPLIGTIDIAFQKPLDPATITAASWTYTAIPPSTFTAKTIYNPVTQAISIHTTTPLANNTQYVIKILKLAIKDVHGSTPSGDFVLRFTTNANNTAAPYIKWTDFKTNGIDINFDFTVPLTAAPAINPVNYNLKCGGSNVDLSGASFAYDAEDRQVSIESISLPEKSACTLTIGTAIVGLNGVALDSDSQTQTTPSGGVHKPFTGENYFSDFAGTSSGSWFKKETCADCKGLWDNPGVKFYNRIQASAASTIAGDTTDYTFTFPVTATLTSGDEIQIIVPSGFDISGINLASRLNIYHDPAKIVKLTSISRDLVKNILTMPLQIGGDGTLKSGILSFIVKDIVNPQLEATDYTFRYQTLSSTGIKEGPNAFNPITIKAVGDGEILLDVLNIKTIDSVANVTIFAQSRAFGIKELVTNEIGGVIISNIPIHPVHGADVDVWIDATRVPGGYLPRQETLHFHLTKADPVQIDDLFLSPAPLQIKGTLTHTGIGSDGETKINMHVQGTSAVFTKTITLDKTGITPYTFDLDAEEEYTISVERFIDVKSISNPVSFTSPPPEVIKLTAAKSPLTANFNLQQTNQRITGTVLSSDGRAITNAKITATLEHSGQGSRFNSDTTTDVNGSYSIAVAPGNYKLDTYVPGFAGKNEKTVVVKTTDVVMNFVIKKPTNALSGNVSDSTGNPVQNVLVNCFDTGGESSTALTDSHGDYVMYVNNGIWSCEAKSNRLGIIPPNDGVTATNINVIAAISNLNFSHNATKFATIRGTLKSESGSLIAGSWIGAEKIDKTTKKRIGFANSTQTDQNGNFSLTVRQNSASEIYRLKTLTGNANFILADNIDVSSTDASLGSFIYPTEKTVTIELKSIPGNVNNVTVNIQNLMTNNFHTANVRFIAGNGSARINLSNANYSARLVIPGFDEKVINFTVSGENTSITFDYSKTAFSAFKIKVNDSSAAPVQGAFVEAFEQTSGRYASATTDAGGTATLNVAPGTYTIKASRQGFVSASIVASENVNDYSLTLKDSSAVITLAVKDTGNVIVPYAWVDAVATDGSNQWTGGKALGDGTLNLNVSAGSVWNVTARSANGAYGTKSGVAAGASDVTITLNQIKSDFIPARPVAQTVNPTTDNVVSSDIADLTIGAGALGNTATDTNLTINKITSISSTNTTTPLGGIGVEVFSTDSTGRSVNTLNSNVVVEVKYDKNQILALLNTNNLRIEQFNAPLSSYDSIKGTWMRVDGATIYVRLQEKAGDDYTTTTIQDFILNFTTGKNYKNYSDFIIYYRGSTNHFSIFAPAVFAPVNSALLYNRQKFASSPVRSSAGVVKDAVLRKEVPCAPEENPYPLILERFIRFLTLQR